MDPKKINGIYRAYHSFAGQISDRKLMGNNRAHVFTTDQFVNASNVVLTNYGQGAPQTTISFVSNNILKIKKIRLRTVGAPGLRPGATSPDGAQIGFTTYKDYGLTDPIGDNPCYFVLKNFNVWENCDVDFIPKVALANGIQKYFIGFVYAVIVVDDYNLQNVYKNLNFLPIIDFEFDTAGVIDNSTGEIV